MTHYCSHCVALTAALSLSRYANNQPKPVVACGVMAMLMNLAGGLIFVLGIPVANFSGYGFIACPIVTLAVEYAQLVYVVTHYCSTV